MQKVLKFATGQEIPKGAVYLWSCKNGDMDDATGYPPNYKFVWHYFLVDMKG
jgi:hypothetical protein